MNGKIKKSILAGVLTFFILALFSFPAFAGTPHTSYGIVTGGQVTDNWTFYVVARTNEKLTGLVTAQGASFIWRSLPSNLPTAWSIGDDSLAFVARETGAGTAAHAGSYAVMNEDLSNINPQPYVTCTIRAIPVPVAAAAPGAVNLTWAAAQTDVSDTPHGNNIAGYNVYRSTNQANGFVKINGALVAATNYTDNTAVANTTYYYAIEPVFRGNVALGLYSANSNGMAPGIPAVTITTVNLPNGTVGTAYSQQLAANGGNGTYTWAISAGALPNGLSLNANTGVISGTPTVANDFTFTVRATSAGVNGTKQFTVTIAVQPVTVTTVNLPNGTVGAAYNQALTANGGNGNYTWSISAGSLPNGLSLNANTGIISGTPTVANNFTFTVQASSAGSNGTKQFTVTIADRAPAMQIDPVIMAFNAVEGGNNPANQTITISNSGGSTLNWTAVKGENWLTINPANGSCPPNSTITVSVNTAGLAANNYQDTIRVTSNGGNTDIGVSLTVTAPTDPIISGILPATAAVGQTIVISGNFFGNSKGNSTVTVGGVAAVPTKWSMQSITLALPAGLPPAAQANVVINVAGKPQTSSQITVDRSKIYLEDFEGGSIGDYRDPVRNISGYYVFENSLDITPNNDNINSQLRQAEAKQAGVYGAKVRYSFNGADGSDWGGGWGGKLANILNLSNINRVSLFIKWDGSANDLNLSLKDSDGTSVKAAIPNGILDSATMKEIIVRKNSFSYDATGSDPGANVDFNWASVAGVNFLYTSKNTTNNYHHIDSITAYTAAVQPTLSGIAPVSGQQGRTVDITITGTDTNWSGSMIDTLHFSGNGITVNSAAATDAETISANITIASGADATDRTVTVDGTQGSLTFTVSAGPVNTPPAASNVAVSTNKNTVKEITLAATDADNDPVTYSITSQPAHGILGQLSGNKISYTPGSDYLGTDSFTFKANDGKADSNIATVGITVTTESIAPPVTPESNVIVIDNFEGGYVGNWVAPNLDSGYYEFDKYDAKYNPNAKSTSYPDRTLDANACEGSKAMLVKYSYGSRSNDANYAGADKDWGGGWGAKLIRSIDLSKIDKVRFSCLWDGSANTMAISLKDADGTAAKADIPKSLLSSLAYSSVTISKSDFKKDPAGSDNNAVGEFDWNNVAGYSFIFTSKSTSANPHYIDNIIAYDSKSGTPSDEVNPPVLGDAPVVNSITPSSAPAGARIVIEGTNFGDPQGQSKLAFANKLTRASYDAEIISWANGKIEAIAPKLAVAGDYEVKVNRIAISKGIMTVMESNAVNFSLTAAAAAGTVTTYPNPFNAGAESVNVIVPNTQGATNIGYYIFDMTAKLVYQVNTSASQITWNGYDKNGSLAADGAYLVRVINEDTKSLLAKGKLLVIKR